MMFNSVAILNNERFLEKCKQSIVLAVLAVLLRTAILVAPLLLQSQKMAVLHLQLGRDALCVFELCWTRLIRTRTVTTWDRCSGQCMQLFSTA